MTQSRRRKKKKTEQKNKKKNLYVPVAYHGGSHDAFYSFCPVDPV